MALLPLDEVGPFIGEAFFCQELCPVLIYRDIKPECDYLGYKAESGSKHRTPKTRLRVIGNTYPSLPPAACTTTAIRLQRCVGICQEPNWPVIACQER